MPGRARRKEDRKSDCLSSFDDLLPQNADDYRPNSSNESKEKTNKDNQSTNADKDLANALTKAFGSYGESEGEEGKGKKKKGGGGAGKVSVLCELKNTENTSVNAANL